MPALTDAAEPTSTMDKHDADGSQHPCEPKAERDDQEEPKAGATERNCTKHDHKS